MNRTRVLLILSSSCLVVLISLTSENGNGAQTEEELYDECLRVNAKNLCDVLFERPHIQNLPLESNSQSNVPLEGNSRPPIDLPQNTTQQTWELFTDPENEFSMDYQPSWQLKPAENRFDRADVNIVNTGGPPSGFVNIQYNILSEKITSMMKEFGYDQKDMENQLESVFPSLISGFTDYESFTQIENAKYDKYKIDGYKAGSFIFSFEQSGVPYAGWIVGSLIGNKLFVFSYVADQNQFDSNLPIAEHMLNSIKILDKGKPDT